MPMGNPLSYLGKKATGARKVGSSFGATRSAHGTFAAIGALGRKSTGGMSGAQLARSGKIRSAAVAGGVLGVNAIGSRRGRGVDKSGRGRPTGMYRY